MKRAARLGGRVEPRMCEGRAGERTIEREGEPWQPHLRVVFTRTTFEYAHLAIP